MLNDYCPAGPGNGPRQVKCGPGGLKDGSSYDGGKKVTKATSGRWDRPRPPDISGAALDFVSAQWYSLQSMQSFRHSQVRAVRAAIWGLLILGLTRCGAPLVVITAEDLAELPTTELRKLQFYSGGEAIIFEAQSDELVQQVRRQALISTSHRTEHRLTIDKNTPGTLVRFDRISREYHIRFDLDLPTLFYQDLGQGLELMTDEIMIKSIKYKRVLEVPRTNRGLLSSGDRRYLAIRMDAETKRQKDRKEASGIRVQR